MFSSIIVACPYEGTRKVGEICKCIQLIKRDRELPYRIPTEPDDSKFDSKETPTSRIYRIRKRKFEDGSQKYSPGQMYVSLKIDMDQIHLIILIINRVFCRMNDPDKKRIALENGVSYKLCTNPNSQPCTPTTSSISSISRTPR